MASAAPPKLIFDQRLTDLNEHASQANLDVEMRQLDRGTPGARIAVMGTPTCTIMRGEYDRSYHQIGSTSADILSIGIPDSDVDEFRWCNKQASGDQILNFSLDNGFDGLCGAGFSGFVISFHHDLLHETHQFLELKTDLRDLLRLSEVLPHSETFAAELRHSILAAFGAAKFSCSPEAADFFDYSAAALVLNHLANNTTQHGALRQSVRERTVSAALKCLEDSYDMPFTVAELGSKIGVSAPTLYRAFMDRFGVSPKKYIQARRLCGVRQELLLSHDTASISDIANRWGFWHMGQFAADYKQHFGNLPSETLPLTK